MTFGIAVGLNSAGTVLRRRCLADFNAAICNNLHIRVESPTTTSSTPSTATPTSSYTAPPNQNQKSNSGGLDKPNLAVIIPVFIILITLIITLFGCWTRCGGLIKRKDGPGQTVLPKMDPNLEAHLESGLQPPPFGFGFGSALGRQSTRREREHSSHELSTIHNTATVGTHRSAEVSRETFNSLSAATPWDPTTSDSNGAREAALTALPPAYVADHRHLP